MKISVVIPTLGRPSLEKCVASLIDADEIILVTDTDIPLVDCYNKGYKQSTGDVIFHTNDRLFFDPNWREEVEKAVEKINNFGVVSFFANLVLAGCLTREYIEKEQGGYLYWPEYFHYYGDNEMGELARMHNHYAEIQGVAHWEVPEITHKVDPKKEAQAAWDKETFEIRRDLGFPREIIRDMKERKKLL